MSLHRPTHVLMWTPQSLLPPDVEPYWDLQTAANYDAGTPQPDYDGYDDPAGCVGAEDLAGWVNEQIGSPVTFREGSVEVRPHRFWGRFETVPVYLVYSAGES